MTKDVKQQVPGNPRLVQWPTDTYQLTQGLKREGTDMARRINGQRDKLATVVATLDTLRAHVISAYQERLALNKAALEDAMKRNNAEVKNNQLRRDSQIEALKARLDTLERDKAYEQRAKEAADKETS